MREWERRTSADSRFGSSVVAVIDKPRRLESANFERAEAALKWEDAANTADETGRDSDQIEAQKRDRELVAADRKIKSIQRER
jgi:hypothetical protein